MAFSRLRIQIGPVQITMSTIVALIAGTVTLLFSLYGMVGPFFVSQGPDRPIRPQLAPLTIQEIQEIQEMRTTIDSLREGLVILKKDLENLGKLPEDYPANIQFAKIENNVKGLDGRLQALETTILDNPMKALSVPLIKKELESLKESHKADALDVPVGMLLQTVGPRHG